MFLLLSMACFNHKTVSKKVFLWSALSVACLLLIGTCYWLFSGPTKSTGLTISTESAIKDASGIETFNEVIPPTDKSCQAADGDKYKLKMFSLPVKDSKEQYGLTFTNKDDSFQFAPSAIRLAIQALNHQTLRLKDSELAKTLLSGKVDLQSVMDKLRVEGKTDFELAYEQLMDLLELSLMIDKGSNTSKQDYFCSSLEHLEFALIMNETATPAANGLHPKLPNFKPIAITVRSQPITKEKEKEKDWNRPYFTYLKMENGAWARFDDATGQAISGYSEESVLILNADQILFHNSVVN